MSVCSNLNDCSTIVFEGIHLRITNGHERNPILAESIAQVFQGHISAEGILHLRNPKFFGPNSGKRILNARSLGPNSWVEKLFCYSFSSKEAPRKIHPQEIHLPKFTFRNSTQKWGQISHIALQGHFGLNNVV